ncbi:hypothetical protein JVT61DRAFT_2870 [Boletus reticuloceps]|uniref:Uncharacterized protein n=1 Tax=Boletus reticuloceps TaxID=495285 RepID=A0A8I2YQ32_9AGAM|nr:hypothetical protein JVT61DRAFT_2870 [Boletus reticuloceps]
MATSGQLKSFLFLFHVAPPPGHLFFWYQAGSKSQNTISQQPYNPSNPSKAIPHTNGKPTQKIPNSDEYNDLPSTKVKYSKNGLKCLEDCLLILIGEPITLIQLSKIIKTLIEPIRAVAYLLEEASAGEIRESISNQIITTLAPQLGETHMATENPTKISESTNSQLDLLTEHY